VIGEFIEEYGDINFSPALEESILHSEVGPAVVYELAKNKKELDRINSLPPLAAAREFGKLEAKLLAKSESPKEEIKKQTKAPKPIEPVGGKSGGAIRRSVYDENLPFKEYVALRRESMRKRA
jgi:hypothetical protein